MLWVLDLDGVVWLAGRPIPGSPEAVARLRAAGEQVAFVTNNAGPTVADHVAALAHAGVDAEPGEVVSSAQAAAAMLAPGSTAAYVGGDGIPEALTARGVHVVGAADHPAAVVVGRAPRLDYDELAAAATAIRGGARFVATNTDSTFPTPEGLLPGAGAVIAYLATAAGRAPEVAGKPHPPVAALVRDRFGGAGMVVGDRLDTDGAFAAAVGAPFALVLTGVSGRADIDPDAPPALVADDLAAAVAAVLDAHTDGGARRPLG
ncbi:MAG TPA: HAD-IIA family hydrolase [Acidimicrobiales bacterium]|nr:HAD-IIA family hydrolase [Acidimicrobiales bacterium]